MTPQDALVARIPKHQQLKRLHNYKGVRSHDLPTQPQALLFVLAPRVQLTLQNLERQVQVSYGQEIQKPMKGTIAQNTNDSPQTHPNEELEKWTA